MSRIGKLKIPKVKGVEVCEIQGGFSVKGPRGVLEVPTNSLVELEEDSEAWSVRPTASCHPRFWGLYNRLLANAVQGVSVGFSKQLELIGTGYRAVMEGSKLKLTIGFSHPVYIEKEEGIQFEIPQPTKVKITGARKELVGRIAAEIRDLRPPEPYHGKGIRYEGEVIPLKVGKSTSKK